MSPVELTGGVGGRRGAKSYDREKAWPSVNHSILSAYDEIQRRNQLCLAFLKSMELSHTAKLIDTVCNARVTKLEIIFYRKVKSRYIDVCIQYVVGVLRTIEKTE